jgi:hypothetical protein
MPIAIMARRVVIVALAMPCILASWSHSARAQSTCLSAKLEAMGKKEAGLLSCLAAETAKGHATGFGRCIRKVAIKFALAWAKAGTCGEERTRCECLTEDCAIALRLTLPDSRDRCEAARLRAAGKQAIQKVRCSAEAVKSGTPVDPACLQRAEANLRAVFARSRRCTGDRTAVETVVNEQCVTALGADPIGGETIDKLCTSHACDYVD